MKAKLEKIEPGFGSSFTIREFSEPAYLKQPHWHFHPEYEIVYISRGRGKRHIGDHISFFEDGDLIFLGPNLPHFGFTEEVDKAHREIVVQMKADFLGADFLEKPEMSKVKLLFERSHLGLSFGKKVKREAGKRLVRMLEQDKFERLIELLRLLQYLALTEEAEILNASGFAMTVNALDQKRMRRIFEYVEHTFREEAGLQEVAGKLNMTVPAFCRYFKKMSGKTFTGFVNEFRVAHACRLLAEEDQTIAAIAFESGFNNLSHFNRQFKRTTGVNPSTYRKGLEKVVRKG